MKHEFTIWYEDEHGVKGILISGIELSNKEVLHLTQRIERMSGRPVWSEME